MLSCKLSLENISPRTDCVSHASWTTPASSWQKRTTTNGSTTEIHNHGLGYGRSYSFDLTTLALGSHSFDHHYRHPLGDLATTTTTKEEKTCLRSTTNMQTQVCAQSDTRKQIPRRSRRFSNHHEKATARTTEHQRHRRCRHSSSSPHSTCHRIPTAQTPPATTTH
jgi:hypothetical protein